MFLSSAFAQDAATAVTAAPGQGSMAAANLVPFLIIIVIFYFLMIRPQQKKMREHQAMVKALKKGDKVVTAGGILGTVSKADTDDVVTVDLADGVCVQVVRSTIATILQSEAGKKPESETSPGKKNAGAGKKSIANDN